jgi:hypothetical protein
VSGTEAAVEDPAAIWEVASEGSLGLPGGQYALNAENTGHEKRKRNRAQA